MKNNEGEVGGREEEIEKKERGEGREKGKEMEGDGERFYICVYKARGFPFETALLLD